MSSYPCNNRKVKNGKGVLGMSNGELKHLLLSNGLDTRDGHG